MILVVGVDFVVYYEGSGYGLIWVDIGEDGFFIWRVFMFLLVDLVLYILLVW